MKKFDTNDEVLNEIPKEIKALKAYMNGVKYLSVNSLANYDTNIFIPYSYKTFNIMLSSAFFSIYAFACELFLKSILIFYNKNAHGHNLKKLYDNLPNEIKDLLDSEKEFIKKDFEDMLEEMGNSFVFFRYDNEHDDYTVPLNFLKNLAETLEKISFNLIQPYISIEGLY